MRKYVTTRLYMKLHPLPIATRESIFGFKCTSALMPLVKKSRPKYSTGTARIIWVRAKFTG